MGIEVIRRFLWRRPGRRARHAPPVGAALHLLRAIADGGLLRAHRDLEGRKAFRLHAPDGSVYLVPPDLVQQLVDAGLIDSNKKFPVATYWLTPEGRAWVDHPPVGVHAANQKSDVNS